MAIDTDFHTVMYDTKKQVRKRAFRKILAYQPKDTRGQIEKQVIIDLCLLNRKELADSYYYNSGVDF